MSHKGARANTFITSRSMIALQTPVPLSPFGMKTTTDPSDLSSFRTRPSVRGRPEMYGPRGITCQEAAVDSETSGRGTLRGLTTPLLSPVCAPRPRGSHLPDASHSVLLPPWTCASLRFLLKATPPCFLPYQPSHVASAHRDFGSALDCLETDLF